MSLSGDERAPWYRPSGADAAFLVLALFVLQGARDSMLDDPGLGWHLRNIDAMRAEGWWLTKDPFTFPHDGVAKEWRTNQWLGELPLYLGWKWAGEEGIAVVVSLVLALMLRFVYRILLRDGVPWPWAIVWTCFAGLGTQVSWVARPNIYTMLFLLWTFRVCDLFHQGRCSRRFTLWLVPLFACWANMHGGFLAGLITLGVALAIETAIAICDFDADRRCAAFGRATHLGMLLAACGTATLINPYGWSLYPWVLKLLGNDFYMNLNREWWSPDFHEKGSFRFEILMLFYPAILALSRRRPNPVELGLGIVWLHFALNGFRYVPLWVLAVIPSMARSTLALPWLEAMTSHFGLVDNDRALLAPRSRPAGWAWSVVIALLLFALAPTGEGRFARHNPKYIPTAALNKLLELHNESPQSRIFHAYDWGGYLTWHGWPGFLNWIDDRNEVQGQQHIEEWNGIVTAAPGWEKKLDDAKVEIVALQPDARLVTILGDSNSRGRWLEVYRDDFAVIFARKIPAKVAKSN